jgi:hypothetical protein
MKIDDEILNRIRWFLRIGLFFFFLIQTQTILSVLVEFSQEIDPVFWLFFVRTRLASPFIGIILGVICWRKTSLLTRWIA